MAVPNTFGTATSAIPLSQLDANFNTPITLGNTAIQLGDTVTTLNNMTLANVTISSGNVTITNVAITTANVSGTANISTLVVVGNETVGGNTSVTGNSTVAGSVVLSGGTANGVAYLNTSKQLTTGSALTWNGSALAVTGTLSATGDLSFSTVGSKVNFATTSSATVNYVGGSADGYSIEMVMQRGASQPLKYKQDYGVGHVWSVAGSDKMTLDASGRLLVGTTNAGSNQGMTIYNATQGELRLQNSTTGNTAADGFQLMVNGSDAYVFNRENAPLLFGTNDTERARIDSSGRLLVGKTSTALAGQGHIFQPNGESYATITTGLNSLHVYSAAASAYRFYVSDAGTVFATNTTISAISDQRLKENIQDLDAGLDKIMALKPRKFDWKKGKGKDIKGDRGFIAQEFEGVFPDLIDEWKDPAPEGEEPYKSVRQDLIPVLVKAIQEQQALITQLTARITALEGA